MTELVRATWALRTTAEYRSAAVASQMLHWCLALGVDSQVVDRLHTLIADELAHTELSRDLHDAAGGAPDAVRIDQAQLLFQVAPDAPLGRRALLAALREYAIHESVALEAFREIARLPLVPRVRVAIARIYRDEARHRRLGWQLLDALLATTGEREWLLPHVPRALPDVEAAYVHVVAPTPAEAAWGLLGPEGYARSNRRARTFIHAQLGKRGLGVGVIAFGR